MSWFGAIGDKDLKVIKWQGVLAADDCANPNVFEMPEIP